MLWLGYGFRLCVWSDTVRAIKVSWSWHIMPAIFSSVVALVQSLTTPSGFNHTFYCVMCHMTSFYPSTHSSTHHESCYPGSWILFVDIWQYFLGEGSVCCIASTTTGQHNHRSIAYVHASSRIRNHDPSLRRKGDCSQMHQRAIVISGRRCSAVHIWHKNPLSQ